MKTSIALKDDSSINALKFVDALKTENLVSLRIFFGHSLWGFAEWLHAVAIGNQIIPSEE